MLLIYTHKITSRLKYIFDLIFHEIICTEYEMVTDLERFIQYAGPKISYTFEPVYDEPFFCATSLLFENDIRDQHIKVFLSNEYPCFYSTNHKSTLPFDPFAACFYLVTRYEEYLPQKRDQYDRFLASESIAFKNNFLQKPMVNIWCNWISKKISERYPALKWKEKKYKFIPTIDVDYCFSYLDKGFMRTLGSYTRAVLQMDLADIKQRTRVLLHLQKDPYNTFDELKELHERHNLDPIYFFLLGDYDLNDKNISVQSRNFRKIIKSTADYVKVGIHPSFASNNIPAKLKVEISRLTDILKVDIVKSRQHFLKIIFPDTYRRLIDVDIEEDYSLGYATDVGFRAGICVPYPYYDLDSETQTNLRIFPFCLMDATLKYYLKINANEAMEHIKPIIQEVKNVKGTFISIWHNDAYSDYKLWQGWKKVYDELLIYAA